MVQGFTDLKRQLEDYRRLFNSVDVAMVVIDPDSNEFVDYNQAYCRLMGFADSAKLLNAHPVSVSPDQQPNGEKSFDKANRLIRQTILEGSRSIEWLHRRPDGYEFLSHIVLDRIEFGGKTCISAVIHDISEQRKLERMVEQRTLELKELATHDCLTGLYNRVHLDHVLVQEKDRSDRSQQAFSIALLDLDNFKDVNDKHGHLVGDRVLKEFAQVLRQNIRQSDTLGRWGGEEFLVLLPQCTAVGAKPAAENLRLKVAAESYAAVGPMTLSAGVATYQPGENITSLFNRVDKALYQAKHSGRNKVMAAE